MASNTTNLNLYKADPVADGDNTFNIQTMLNENWDKIDSQVAKKTDIPTVPTSLPANGGNSTTVNNHTAAATPSTTEKTDLIGMVNEVKDEVDTHKAEFTTQKQHTTVKSNKDSNGIWQTITLKRSDGTIYMASVLSGGTSPQYTTRTETYYKTDGTTVDVTKTYTRTYDSDGDLLSEVMS